MSEKLKPCPWCGGPPRMWGAQDGSNLENIGCANEGCPVFEPSTGYLEFEDAVRIWNHRPLEQQLVEALKGLVAAA